MKELSIFNEEAKCFELFGFLDKGRNGYISKVDLIDTFTPFNQNYREHLFQKNSREIKEISGYSEDTKHLLRSIFKTFKRILDFEKKSKRDLYGYTRDFLSFWMKAGTATFTCTTSETCLVKKGSRRVTEKFAS